MECIFCRKLCKSANSLRNHERLCPSNQNRQTLEYWSSPHRAPIVNASNQYIKAKKEGRTVLPRSEDFRKRAAIKSRTIKWTDEQREAHSARMRKSVINHPESYSSSNRGRTKQIIVDNVKLQGQWEVDFYLWAKGNNLTPQRPLVGFPYEYDGSRTYYPDFYLPTLDLYVEVKGYETEKDLAKWKYFPHRLIVLKYREIRLIRNNEFSIT